MALKTELTSESVITLKHHTYERQLDMRRTPLTADSSENSKTVTIKVIKVSNSHDCYFSSSNIFMISILTSEALQSQSAKFKLLPQNMSWPGAAFAIIYTAHTLTAPVVCDFGHFVKKN